MALTVFFAKGGSTFYTSYQSWMFWSLLQCNLACCINTPTNKLEHSSLVSLALKGGDWGNYWLSSLGNYACAVSTFNAI